jgi:sigma-E factor negative regulatory protein RseC
MLIAAFIAMQIHSSDLSAIVGAIAGLLLGFIWVKGYSTSNQYFLLQQPVILRLVDAENVIKFC